MKKKNNIYPWSLKANEENFYIMIGDTMNERIMNAYQELFDDIYDKNKVKKQVDKAFKKELIYGSYNGTIENEKDFNNVLYFESIDPCLLEENTESQQIHRINIR